MLENWLKVAMSSFVISEVELTRELSAIVNVYYDLRINCKNLIALCIFSTMILALSSKLSYSLLLLTLLFVTGTLVYLTISMQDTVHTLQRNLFAICYKHLHSSSDNTDYQSEESVAQE